MMDSNPSPLKQLFLSRLPAGEEIKLVFSMAAFCVFTWALRNYFYEFPSLILSHPLVEIIAVAAYTLSAALIETLLVTAFWIGLACLLPGVLLKNGFAYKASLAILAGAAVSIHLQLTMSNQPTIVFLATEFASGLALWLVPVSLATYFPRARKIALDALERLTIFIYIYIPLGGLSLLVVIARLIA